ncbi:MAG TPA: SDR family oxidoreductase [Candidatus Binataceae bacterium]|nr:SDR family oxidoreductase [Candidatus Binataceae bacterium]
MFDLKGKVALVTGGTRGIGRGITLALAQAGATLALNYRQDESSAQQTLERIRQLAPRSILVKADLEDEEQTRSMVGRAAAELGRLDFVVINAVTTTTKPLLTVKPTSFWRTMAMNVGGLFITAQEAAKVIADNGRIVVISGTDVTRYSGPNQEVLHVAKSAMESMVHQLAFALGPRGITVNGLGLGMFDTDSTRFLFGDRFDDFAATMSSRTALRRIGVPADVGGVVAMLCSPLASYITGQIIMVDGGTSAMTPFTT